MRDKKRIFDIKPCREDSKESPGVSHREPRLPRAEIFKSAEFGQKPISRTGKLALLFCGIVLLGGGVLSYFFIPHKVRVEIWPEQKIIEETVITAVKAGQGDINHIPGETIREEKTVSQDFPATGTKLKSTKARGIIRVYNNYSTASQPLLAATRFISDDGKLFRTPTRVVIPGGHYEGGKLVPGFADIEVTADQPGEDYNIDPSTFSIPGFAGTSKYTAFYGKSLEPMKGGVLNEVSQVSRADLDKAKEILTQKAVSGVIASLKDSLSSKGYIVFEEAVVSELADFQSEAKAGEELETFAAEARAAARALVFKESDLKNFAANRIKEKILPEEKLIDSFFKIEYFLESINLSKPELSLKLVISSRSYSIPEDIRIKEMIKNKSSEDTGGIIKSVPGVKRAKVDFWPFWVKFAPGNLKDIEVVLHLD